jgi:hypothetical protein
MDMVIVELRHGVRFLKRGTDAAVGLISLDARKLSQTFVLSVEKKGYQSLTIPN